MTEPQAPVSLYDQVLDALVGGTYHLDALLMQLQRGVPLTTLDVQRLAVLLHHQREAATAFHAWWQAHSMETGDNPCPR